MAKTKANTMQKIGKTIKDTFMEMSSGLAGWIDDVSATPKTATGTKNKQPSPKPVPEPEVK